MERHAGTLADPSEAPRDRDSISSLLRRRDENLVQSAVALADVLAHVDKGLEATPQVARSSQATENRWRAMEKEFGLLDSVDVAELLGSSPANRNRAHSLAKEGRILGIRRGRKILYPGFQFDRASGEIRPAISKVAGIARAAGWEDRHVLQWFCAPNGYLGGGRPVDTLEDEGRLLEAARSDLAARW